ncbi:hypothetical protein LDL48_00100 [Wangella sp. NEAU-J3]|nr:hypothetical protein [Jidongwangia harbinensis]MCA2211267.1 hypothetical protein [Jidongwangia harbinensis]
MPVGRLPYHRPDRGRIGAERGVQVGGRTAGRPGQRGGEFLHRFRAGGEQHGGRVQGGQQPGPQQRRLAAAGRAEHGRQRGGVQPPGQLGHQVRAAEEAVGVAGVEGGQPEVRRVVAGRLPAAAAPACSAADRLSGID